MGRSESSPRNSKGARPTPADGAEAFLGSVEITGDLDRQAAEVLWLELRRLARHHNVEIEDFRIEEGDDAGSGGKGP
jgi:hypothetical protein